MGKECGRKECPVSTKVNETEISGLVFFSFCFNYLENGIM